MTVFPRLLLAAALAGAPGGVSAVAVTPLWGLAGAQTYTAAATGGTPTAVQWYDGDPDSGGTAIAGATSLTYAPSASFGTNALYCVCDGVKSAAAATVAGVWSDASTFAATADTGSLTPSGITAKRGQQFLVAAHTIGASFDAAPPNVGGVPGVAFSAALVPSSNRYVNWFKVSGPTGANPALAWVDPGTMSSIVIGYAQVVGFDLSGLAETMKGAIDTGNDNDPVSIAFTSRSGLTLSFGSRLSVYSAGHAGLTAGVTNVVQIGSLFSTATSALTVTMARASGTQADRMVSGIRLAPTGTPVDDVSLAAFHPILF